MSWGTEHVLWRELRMRESFRRQALLSGFVAVFCARVVRISSAAVIDRLDEVLATIRDAVTTRRAKLPPSPPVGENCRAGTGVDEPLRSPRRRPTRHDQSDA